ncbi:Glycerol-3-phosphate dehydrogenase [Melia azedarach]|uniref:Glycerol-3-phosphate dehydrogenase n=1 Tax=Melia azedarach TaxID=155640 RepID=A0ACC1XJT4_MELAZ|nr:Glycerol-3-phosphate dehydrogenase [Melia azedarach]
MSLVDYASSSDDEVSEAEEEQQRREDEQLRIHNGQSQFPKQPPPPSPNLINQTSKSSSNQRPEIASPSLPPPSFEKLPDASVLLNSASMPVVTGTDHASRVAAAMAESSTRKRDSNGLTSTLPRSKLPKGNLPHSKNVLDTAGGLLVPPQLSGRMTKTLLLML